MDTRLLYVAVGSAEEAKRLARTLVEERLVACANVLDGATSFYWWEGAVQSSGEAILIAKTRADRVEEAIARIKALHGYDCPGVVALPILAGNPDYLAWIGDEARPES